MTRPCAKGVPDSATRAQLMGGSLRRAIPILVAAQQLRATDASPANSMVEVQILNLAEKYDAQINGAQVRRLSQAGGKRSNKNPAGDYDSMIVDAFVKAFGQKAQAAAQ